MRNVEGQRWVLAQRGGQLVVGAVGQQATPVAGVRSLGSSANCARPLQAAHPEMHHPRSFQPLIEGRQKLEVAKGKMIMSTYADHA